MKKSTLLLFVFVLLCACAPSAKPTTPSATVTEPSNPTLEPAGPVPNDSPAVPTATVPPSTGSQVSGVTTDILNIRAGPGINYAILGQLKQGEAVTIVGKSQDGLWWQIRRGWVSATYIQVSGDISPVPVSTPRAAPTP